MWRTLRMHVVSVRAVRTDGMCGRDLENFERLSRYSHELTVFVRVLVCSLLYNELFKRWPPPMSLATRRRPHSYTPFRRAPSPSLPVGAEMLGRTVSRVVARQK